MLIPSRVLVRHKQAICLFSLQPCWKLQAEFIEICCPLLFCTFSAISAAVIVFRECGDGSRCRMSIGSRSRSLVSRESCSFPDRQMRLPNYLLQVTFPNLDAFITSMCVPVRCCAMFNIWPSVRIVHSFFF